MSFRDRATFSFVATREKQHGERLPSLPKYDLKVLPVAAIYGGNASGKTNLVKALHFAQELVVRGTQPDSLISVDSFCLGSSHSGNQPTRFEFELFIDGMIYEFSFSLTHRSILEEKLVCVVGSKETVWYHRVHQKPNFHKSIAKDQALEFAFKGTRDNQLFLTNAVSQQVLLFKPIYEWFKHRLVLIAPESKFGPFELFFDEKHPFYAKMNQMLAQLDTGISRLGSEEVPFANAPFPEALKKHLQEELAEGMTRRVIAEPSGDRYIVTRRKGDLQILCKKLIAYHLNESGSAIKFDIQQESDGSQRIIDLLPAFLSIVSSDSPGVYVIDEIDRSLHTLLIRQLLEWYLASCSPESRSQLLFTTHNVLLMDQDLLRRDEMWVTERNTAGASTLLSFSEYKDVRSDKDIQKSYLQGRLGGIPRLLLKPQKGK